MTAPSLASPDLAPVFDAIRTRLERSGIDARGKMRLPTGTSAKARYLLAALVDAPVGNTIDLNQLECKLAVLGVGGDLSSALRSLGHPVSDEPALRRQQREKGRDARRAAREEVSSWHEDWATEWIEEVIKAGVLAGLDGRRGTAPSRVPGGVGPHHGRGRGVGRR